MKFFNFLLLSFSFLLPCSLSNLRKSKRSDHMQDEAIVSKRLKSSGDQLDLADYLELIMENNYVSIFEFEIKMYGLSLMDPNETSILRKCVDKEYIESLKSFFNIMDTECFEVLLDALKMAIRSSKLNVFKALAVPTFIKNIDQQALILEFVLKIKRFDLLKILLENGFDFVNWRSKRNLNIGHIIIQNDLTDCIRYVSNVLLFAKDRTGRTPLFYARSVKMIKSIRRRQILCRSQLNKAGRTPWQEALISKNFELLDALISQEKRKIFWKLQQLDYFNLDWVKSAALLRINRDSLLRDSFHQTMYFGQRLKWYRTKPKFFIEYVGENGLDGSGLKVDWISNLLTLFFATSENGNVSDYTAPLFVQVDEETGLYAPNIKYKNPYLFRFAGSVIGIALAMNIGIKAKFIPAIYKGIYHEKLDLNDDLLEQSPTIHRHLQILKDPSIKLSDLELTMPSKPTVRVIRRNLAKYIEEFSTEVLYGRYKAQISYFIEGFDIVQAVRVTHYFKKDEFKAILTGKPVDFTVDEFANVLSCSCENSKQALIRFVAEISVKQRELLIKFITGLNSLPVNGLAGLDSPIKVSILNSLIGKLPTSSTCSSILKLPPFVNYETLSRTLLQAIEWTNTTDNEHTNERIVLQFDDDDDDEHSRDSDSVYSDTESEVSESSEDEEEPEENDAF